MCGLVRTDVRMSLRSTKNTKCAECPTKTTVLVAVDYAGFGVRFGRVRLWGTELTYSPELPKHSPPLSGGGTWGGWVIRIILISKFSNRRGGDTPHV